MKTKWETLANYLGGDIVYQVARIIDTNGIRHAGNLEFAKGIYETREQAQEEADRLNALEEKTQ